MFDLLCRKFGRSETGEREELALSRDSSGMYMHMQCPYNRRVEKPKQAETSIYGTLLAPLPSLSREDNSNAYVCTWTGVAGTDTGVGRGKMRLYSP